MAGQVMGFIIFLLLARLLGPEDFGLVAFAGVYIRFMGPIVDQGFAAAIMQRQELEPEHLDTAFWTNLAIAIGIAALTAVNAKIISKLFAMPQLEPVLVWLSLSFIFMALSGIQDAILRRKFGFKAIALRSLVAVLVGGVVGVIMAFLGYGVWSLVGRELVTPLVSVFLLWRTCDWRPSFTFSIRHFKELFHFGIHILGNNLLTLVNRRSDRFIIGYVLGPVALGYYTVAYRVLDIMVHLFSSTIQRVAMPTYARLQNEPERLKRAFYSVMQMISLIVFPAFLGVCAIAPELVPALFGEKWAPSIPVMQILTFFGLLQCLLAAKGAVIVGVGKPAWRFGLQVIYAVANVIGFLIAVKWGIVAVAASYAVVGYFFAPLWFYAVYRLIHIRIGAYLWHFFPPLFASIIMLACVLALKTFLSDRIGEVMIIPIFIMTGVIVYILAIRLLSPALAKEAWDQLNIVFSKGKTI